MAAPQVRDPELSSVSRSDDLANEQWNTRMAWSVMAAFSLHATALVPWPGMVGSMTMPGPALASAQPLWISPYDPPPIGAAAGVGEGKADAVSSDVGSDEVDRLAGSPDGQGASSDPILDRLAAESAYMPTISGSEFAGVAIGVGRPGVGRGSATPSADRDSTTVVVGGPGGDPSATGYDTLLGLSPLDLENLSAIQPDVVLEAATNWVLVRNPGAVQDFMIRHDSSPGQDLLDSPSVSVALWINTSGAVEWAEVITSSGQSDLDEIALDLFNDVVSFRPARLHGVPMPMSAIFTVSFR